jgi:hypothetical protein
MKRPADVVPVSFFAYVLVFNFGGSSRKPTTPHRFDKVLMARVQASTGSMIFGPAQDSGRATLAPRPTSRS